MRDCNEENCTWDRTVDKKGITVVLPHSWKGTKRGTVDGMDPIYWVCNSGSVKFSGLICNIRPVSLLSGQLSCANIAAFVISVLNAFFWNDRYVFKQGNDGRERVWWKALLRTYLSYAFSALFLTEILLYVEINVLGLPKLLGPVINLVITTPINFVMNKFWAFNDNRKRNGE